MNDLARAAQVRGNGDSVSAEAVEATLAAICEPRTPGPMTIRPASA